MNQKLDDKRLAKLLGSTYRQQVHSMGLVQKCSPIRTKQEPISIRSSADLYCDEDDYTQRTRKVLPKQSSATSAFPSQSLSMLFFQRPTQPKRQFEIPALLKDEHRVNKLEVDPLSRATQMGVILQMAQSMGITNETAHQAVNYCERYFERSGVVHDDLLPMAAAFLWVAGKYADVCVPALKSFMKFAGVRAADSIVNHELRILSTLGFALHSSTHLQQLNVVLLGIQIFCQRFDSAIQFIQYQVQMLLFEGYDGRQLRLKENVKAQLIEWLERSLLDPEVLAHSQAQVCLGLVYVALGFDLGLFQRSHLNEIMGSSRFLFVECQFNRFFIALLREYGMEIAELLAAIQFVAGVLDK